MSEIWSRCGLCEGVHEWPGYNCPPSPPKPPEPKMPLIPSKVQAVKVKGRFTMQAKNCTCGGALVAWCDHCIASDKQPKENIGDESMLEPCGDCGFDHDVDYASAHKWHTENPGSYD